MPALPLNVICDFACEPSLLPRVRIAIALIAREVFAETQDVPGYPLRWNLARTVLSPTEDQALQMMVGIVASPPVLAAAAAAADAGATDSAGIAAGVTDEQLLEALRSGWNALAGVSPLTEQTET
ncbi:MULTISPECIES: hypothetical protein [Streptomyces]|uniref:Uncharacterized protein n=1 Tax=Streptomyces galilaeus TaxID=33899 RepID=A0ABW9IYP1_STRGJ